MDFLSRLRSVRTKKEPEDDDEEEGEDISDGKFLNQFVLWQLLIIFFYKKVCKLVPKISFLLNNVYALCVYLCRAER